MLYRIYEGPSESSRICFFGLDFTAFLAKCRSSLKNTRKTEFQIPAGNFVRRWALTRIVCCERFRSFDCCYLESRTGTDFCTLPEPMLLFYTRPEPSPNSCTQYPPNIFTDMIDSGGAKGRLEWAQLTLKIF
jgi:hypothetical protein